MCCGWTWGWSCIYNGHQVYAGTGYKLFSKAESTCCFTGLNVGMASSKMYIIYIKYTFQCFVQDQARDLQGDY